MSCLVFIGLHEKTISVNSPISLGQTLVVSQSESENSGCLDRTSTVTQAYQLLETETVASPQSSVVSHSETENSGCLDRTSAVTMSYQLQETETVASPQSSVVSRSETENSLYRN